MKKGRESCRVDGFSRSRSRASPGQPETQTQTRRVARSDGALSESASAWPFCLLDGHPKGALGTWSRANASALRTFPNGTAGNLIVLVLVEN